MFAVLAASPAATSAATLDLIGKSDLGGGGLNGQVATVGNTAIVASGILGARNFHTSFYDQTYTCLPTTVKLVDVSSPSSPSVVAQIPLAAATVANDVAAVRVNTPSFSGDLLAVALARCDATAENGGVVYYNITNPANPVLLGRYQPDANRPNPRTGCGGPPTGTGPFPCPSMDQVVLVQRPDGRVLSLSTQPFSSANQGPGFDPTGLRGDLRVVDVTNPAAPVEVGSYPNEFPDSERPPGFNGQPSGYSNNGCRPFDGAEGVGVSPDGSRALLPFFDQGLFTVDLTNPADPATLGQYQYPRADRGFEGNAAYVDFATVGGRSLALVGEADWIAPNSSLRIDGSSSVAGSKFACESTFTAFDPEDTAQVYRRPGSQVPGGIVYVGLGQPGSPLPAGVDVRGKIALRDRNRVPSRQGPGGPVGSTAAAVKRLQDEGAVGVITGGTSTSVPQSLSADGNPTGITIPTFSLDTGDTTAVRDALCPAPATPPTTLVVQCGPGGETLSGAMVDSKGAWGALRVVDVTNPAAPTLRGVYQPPASLVFPPPDLGVYSVNHAVASGSTAYVAGHANGVRAIDLTSANPAEIASFVPPDTPDPTSQIPGKANVTGVDVAANGSVVVSDTNSGLYVLRLTPTPAATPTPTAGPYYGIPTPTPTPTATATPTVKRKRPGLSATVRPKRDRRRPFRYTTRGTLRRPSGVSRAAGCRGKVRITIKRRGSGKTLSSRLASVKSTCKFTRKVSFKTSRRFGTTRKARRRGTLRFTIRFQGNARLTPRTVKRTARYG